jgi:uncharacterized protein YkwD
MSVARRPASSMLAVLLAVTLLSFGSATAVANQAPTQPEARLLQLVNDARKGVGRVALRWDSRLADVAQWRSNDMVARNYFGHISWDVLAGRIEDKGISWFGLAETLVKGTPRPAMESAVEAMQTWRNSQAHWDLLSSADYNYVAIGMARDSDGWYYWTALLLKGPDRTPPTAAMTSVTPGSVTDGRRRVTVHWTGADVQLSVLTSGLRDFKLQRRKGSGRWVTVTRWTTATGKTFRLRVGKTYKFRIRARDNKGNKSTWSVPLRVTP